MTDLSTLSDADLTAAYNQSIQDSRAPTPEGFTGTRMTVGAPDLSKMSDDELKAAYEAHSPSTAKDVAKSAGVGIGRGVIGLGGAIGDLSDLGAKGLKSTRLDFVADRRR
jgi:hypothetical protein